MVSIIIPCKNRLHHLSNTIVHTKRLEGEYEIIIIDYNCPMGTAPYFDTLNIHNLKTVRAEVGEKDWNLSHARNLGYKESKGDALLFIDADTCIKSNFLTQHTLKEGEFYTGTWLHASGCCMMWKKDFESVKGYNEISGSWGSEDYDLYRRLVGIGLKQIHFIEKLYKNMPHHDRIRNEYHGKKNIHISNEENYQLMQKHFKSCIE